MMLSEIEMHERAKKDHTALKCLSRTSSIDIISKN